MEGLLTHCLFSCIKNTWAIIFLVPQMLDEVRGVGPQKKGTALAGNTTSDLVILMKNVPTEANVSNTMQKVR